MNSSTTHPFAICDETILNENLFSNNFFSLDEIDELDLSLAPDLDLEFNDYMQFESLEDFQNGNNTSFFPESLENNSKCNDLFFPEITNLETVANEPVSPMLNECTDISEVKIANTNSPVYDLLKIEQYSPVQIISNENEIENQNQNENKNQNKNQNQIEVVTNNDQIASKQQTKQKPQKTITTKALTKKQPLRRSTRRRTPKAPIVSTRVTRSSRRSKNTNNQPKQQKKPTNMRKRRHPTTKGNNSNNTIIENGREIFKLLTGQLWIMSGGSTYKFLLPYTETFAQAIGEKLNADEKETNEIKSQLKYLLSNSRRTFTEYVLEIFLSVLSLVHLKSKPKPQLSVRFKKVLLQIKDFQMNQTKSQKKTNHTDNNQTKPTTTHDKVQFEIKINHKLEKIASKIFTQEVLMYWFEKRFFPRFENIFSQENQTYFHSNYLFELAKSKFILMSWILAKELLKRDGPVQQYSKLIDLEYNKNPVNLYTNNRGRKLRLIKELIVKFGLNNGNYWDSSSTTFFNQNNLTINTLLNQQPFKQIIENPLLDKFSKNNTQNAPLMLKKRTLATNSNKEMIGLDWISKNRILNNSIDFSQI
ncbi:gata zinc finger domain-containing protein [Anaeramoeba flamelloides]|uniref:Gata zinc finger domain-containing protein n=1 Tax=Anaeramoeba flamelloides TaxID=1746091 RepID=A0ABQ8XPQ5_9EUKA|nr:gata zinc finger domain-containing protein [Anaeramoeba flamelloides]